MLLRTGKKWTEIFSPSGNLKAGPGPRDSHQLLVKRTQKEVMTPEKDLLCKGTWPEPRQCVCLKGISNSIRSPDIGDPSVYYQK